MSYKVGNGFIFLEGPECFPHLIREARSLLASEARKLFKRKAFAKALNFFDSHTLLLSGLPAPESPDGNHFMSAAIRALGENEAWLDSSIAIHEFEGRYYGRLFSAQPEFTRLFHAMPLVSPFGYWDSTDPDPDVPGDEWAERGRVWTGIDKDASNGIYNLLDARLTMTSHLVHTPIGRDEVADYTPDFDSRVAEQVCDLVLKIAVAAPIDTDELLTVIERCRSGQMPLAQHLDGIVRPLLKSHPDAFDLWGWEP